MNLDNKEIPPMQIISVQSKAGGTGVTLTAAELVLQAQAQGQRVLAVDTSPSRCLKRDIERAGFHYLDDVRQLFRPLQEARWALDPMPSYGILHYPEVRALYLAAAGEGMRQVGYSVAAGQEERADHHLRSAIAFFEAYYDLMIIDVANTDKRLMQLFHDVSDTAHVMLRDDLPQCGSVDDWRSFIERPYGGEQGPHIVLQNDRKHVPFMRDKWGNSFALIPYLEAGQGAFRYGRASA
jgi:cellulose biosynthesis protein BcsQ